MNSTFPTLTKALDLLLTPKRSKYMGIGLAMCIACAIYIADTTKSNILIEIVGKIPLGDKINHFFLFGLLSFFITMTYPNKKYFNLEIGAVVILGVCFFEELSQIYFPSRNFDLWDMLANILGITFFTYLSRVCLKRIKKRNSTL